ncbi:polynucleotide kinase [Mycobacterium phage Cali]|uniref:Polynucleotide kinase n=2 Tax=Bixzunavirus TaxID=680114 RepID=A0A3G3BZD8_9CAUD|nr:gp248 [Mycobacterium phage Cali]YP_010057631.1 polynucleotide kinase [Mycobacterium phage CharlieB]ACH63199.1 polynucleotide kinase [Mycobacterium phage Cali]AYP69643.1 polynucleotide kinase [Mycobacterium phage CharlieB]QAY05179.1 polynucleotide kinase [Mycobacterium phage Shaqnato]
MKMRARPSAAIMDMDGTLADVSTIRHLVDGIQTKKDFHAFHAASEFVPANKQAIAFGKRHHRKGNLILVVTARKKMWERVTLNFLDREVVHHFPVVLPIFMRGNDDNRKDIEVKRDILAEIRERYTVVAACDDNPNVIKLWEEEQIPEIEVIPGWDHDAAARYAVAANRVRSR